jgi:RHS repeat-associated protein
LWHSILHTNIYPPTKIIGSSKDKEKSKGHPIIVLMNERAPFASEYIRAVIVRPASLDHPLAPRYARWPRARSSYRSPGLVTDASPNLSINTPTKTTERRPNAAQGALSAMQMGNGKWEHTLFNSRLQVTEIGLGTSSTDASLLKLEYKYGMLVNGVLDPTKNNGNPQSQKITAPKTTSGNLVLTQSYVYDGVNRLQTASEDGTPSWQQTYDCDRYGNRAMRNTSYLPAVNNGLTPLSVNSTDYSAFNQATNRLSVVSNPQVVYDGAGNLTRDQIARLLAYDGENRQVNFNNGAVQYFYDGDGRRVKKNDGSGTTVYVNDAGGKLIAEYTSGTPSGSGTSYVTRDVLGSTRVVTRGDGNVRARYDYLPYGEEIEASKGGRTEVAGYGGADTTRQKFTTKERDTESGLDYFEARYYSSAQGRFTSVDPGNANATRKDPQSWNGYAYSRNNPLKYIDPDGFKYRLIDMNGNEFDDYSDEDFDRNFRNNKNVKLQDGLIYSKDENGKYQLIGQYERLSFDDFGAGGNLFYQEMSARRGASLKAIATFGVGTYAIGATGGAAAYFGGVALGGSSLTTLEIGQVTGTTAVETGAATIGINARIYAELEKQLAKDGAQSILRALRSAEKALQEHLEKLPRMQYKSQVEKTIRNVQKQIETIKQFIKDKGL